MSYITDVNHNNCTTIQDVFDKYTSKEARRKYTYRLREVTKKSVRENDEDEDSIGAENLPSDYWVSPGLGHISKVNKEIKADIDSDLRRVVTLMHDECASYVADMTKNGVMQMLSITDLRRIKLFLKGFDEINNNICSKPAKAFVQRMPDDVFIESDEEDELCVETYECDGELLFPISSDAVLNYIAPVRDSLEKLNVKLKTVVMDCFMDAIIEAKTPKKDETDARTKV